ncbi:MULTISPECIES: DUF418 domain-containing protein [Pseudonocardia]|uniref:DUF418 domain-containing protein n=2 Tax=Pseudonocardia TaxID=1847 RepID=A0A1Y2MV82_PSEAH|nr:MULTISPECIES: DUF418 domain-containing protein [Pseudonocardia]OSY39085.1 hypothetical protein BG845_03654 [Pseudonocardia autotrophica]TDN71319.1 putative membrane protein YeiB [Pseudonocardia autotrophica]BBG01993.1 hypothetical protein Pdca_32020 [Pseudonocardia autotrophica]GEC23157.1 hypothetical protein PSA01_01860 [Pseudonocardia saturnea]
MTYETERAPRPGTGRMLAPDLARGAMLLLIAMAYAGVYAGVPFGTPTVDAAALDRVAAVATTLLLDNRAFPMFAILFGYGLAWSVVRQRRRGVPEADSRRLVRRRGLFLVLFGLVHAILVFPGEILASYGLAALLTGWLLFRPDRTVRRAAVWIAAGYALTVPLGMIGLWSMTVSGSAAEVIPGYTTAADWITRIVGAPITPLYIGFAYPLLLLVVLGYLAARAGLLEDPAAHRRTLARIAVAGISVSVLGALPVALIITGVLAPGALTGGLLFALQVLTGVAGGAGYAAAFALLGLRLQDRAGPVTGAVAAMGRRSLSFYLLNSVLVAAVLHPDLGGLGRSVGNAGALAAAVAVWLVSLLIAARLEAAGRPGPADALMRRLVSR